MNRDELSVGQTVIVTGKGQPYEAPITTIGSKYVHVADVYQSKFHIDSQDGAEKQYGHPSHFRTLEQYEYDKRFLALRVRTRDLMKQMEVCNDINVLQRVVNVLGAVFGDEVVAG